MQPTNYLVMWSGGIDSTYVLAKMLKETSHKVFAHHIDLNNCEGRGIAERIAVQALAKKMQEIRPFHITVNMIDDSRMPTIVYDMARVCFEAGAVSKGYYHHPINPITLDKWTIGTHQAEGHNWERWEVIKHATRAAEWTAGRKDWIEFELPEMVSKKEEIMYLKEYGLFDDCWYCRTPMNGRPCNRCKTCAEVKEALN